MNTQSASLLKTCSYVMISLIAALVFVLSSSAVLFWIGIGLAVLSVLIVQGSELRHPKTRLIPMFFGLAAVHCVYGYWAAGKSAFLISIGTDATEQFRRAVYVIGATLLVAAFTYDIASQYPANWVVRLKHHVSCTDERGLIMAARMLAVLA